MFRVRTVFQGMQGAPWLSTLYFQSGGVLTASDAAGATGVFWAAVDNFIDSQVSWSTDTDVATVDPVTGDTTAITTIAASSGVGSSVGDALPLATQGLVRWRTGVFIGGREVRGRTFIPGITEAGNDNGNLLAATQASILAASQTLIADPNSQLLVWSRKNFVAHPVSAASVWDQFASVRSRRD